MSGILCQQQVTKTELLLDVVVKTFKFFGLMFYQLLKFIEVYNYNCVFVSYCQEKIDVQPLFTLREGKFPP